MKKVAFIPFFLFLLSMISCQKEETLAPDYNENQSFKSTYTENSCEEFALNYGSENYYIKTDQIVVTWGNNKSKTVDIQYYNTETEFVLKVKSTNGWKNLIINGNGVWTGGPVAPNVWGTYSVSLPSGWEKCDDYNFTLQVVGNGPPAVFNVVYNLIGIYTFTSNGNQNEEPVCLGESVTLNGDVSSGGNFTGGQIKIQAFDGTNYIDVASADVTETNKSVSYTFTPEEGQFIFRTYYTGGGNGYNTSTSEDINISVGECGCEEDFTYTVDENLRVVFTYKSESTINNAIIKFTCPHIAGFEANDGKKYSVNISNNQTVITWRGNIFECEDLIFDFTFKPDCQQNQSGVTCIWTDFKVNNVSKKGDNSNITYQCNE